MANPSKLNQSRQDEYASDSYLRRIKAEIRKTNKPIMEKKRRARINHYLNDLKGLLLDAMKKDPVRHSKLEKADILDLTVQHLQDIERRRLAVAMAVDPSVPEKFAHGYRECIDEIAKYFDTLGSVDAGLKGRVRKHLESCLTFPSKVPPFPGGVGFGIGGGGGGGGGGPFAGIMSPQDDINNNATQGLLNRVFANNLSLSGMFGAGGSPFLGEGVPLAAPFQPFPFFGAPRTPAGPPFARDTFDQEVPDVKRRRVEKGSTEEKPPKKRPLVVPSPPASPAGSLNDDDDHDDDDDDDDVDDDDHHPGTTHLTPVGKAGALSEHHMERLLAIFPTPPTPEDHLPPHRRFGKLGHHFGASPFVPTARAAATGRQAHPIAAIRAGDPDESTQDGSPDTSREEERPSGNASRERPARAEHPKDRPEGDEGKDNPANGEMWRPW